MHSFFFPLVYQHTIPFVIVITIMFSSVLHDYIHLDYPGGGEEAHCSGFITPQENTILIVETYPARFSQDVGT